MQVCGILTEKEWYMFWRTSFLFVSFFNDFSEENFVPFLRHIIVSRNDDDGVKYRIK